MALVPNRYLALGFITIVVMLAVFTARGVYDSWRGRSPLRLLYTVATAWGLSALLVVAALIMLGQLQNFPGEWLAWSVILAFLLMVMGRVVAFSFLRVARARGWNMKRVLIVGAGNLARDLLQRVESNPWTGFKVAAFFDENEAAATGADGGVPVLTDPAALAAYVENESIAEVWVALPLRDEDRLQAVLEQLRHSTTDIRFVPDFFGYNLINHAITNIAGVPMIDLSSSPMQGFNRLLKAAEDYVLAAMILVATSPLAAVIALAVKLSSPGPVLFKQHRHGWDGQPFKVYKFRTMKVHAEPPGEVTQAKRNDPRTTPLGAFLRRTNLDELPQFFNVLQGRMSIVGPRPHAIEHGEFYKDQVEGYMKRHKVKPGITGWAQVNGYRGETDTVDKMEKRVEYDLYYINNWSLGFDLRIILLTLVSSFRDAAAY